MALLLAVVFCLVCLVVGSAFIIASMFFIRDARYPTTVAKIVHSSEVWGASGKSSRGGEVYGRSIEYEYSVGSQWYRGDAFPSGSTEQALSKFTVGQTVLIGYKPSNPDYSFLAPVSFPRLWLALGSIFGSAGVWGSYRISMRFRKRKQ
jgi:hypothetical protein